MALSLCLHKYNLIHWNKQHIEHQNNITTDRKRKRDGKKAKEIGSIFLFSFQFYTSKK